MTSRTDPVQGNPLKPRRFKLAASALALGLGLALAGCGGMPTNRSLDNVHQPVVEHTNYTFDMTVQPEGGIDPVQQHRLSDWFAAVGLKYGDHVALDDPAQAGATHAAVEAVAAKFGLILDDARAFASVPGCPDWSGRSDANFTNGTSRNYGCATSSNLAAMIANKEDLIHGQDGTGNTIVLTNTKAIDAYRTKAVTGAQSLKQTSTKSD